MTSRTLVAAALLAPCMLGAAVAHATPNPASGVVYVARASSARAARLTLTVDARAAAAEGLLMTFSTVGRPARLYGGTGVTEFGTDAVPRAWSAGTATPGCPAAAPCTTPLGNQTLRFVVDAGPAETVYVAVVAASVHVSVSRGWSLVARAGAFRRVSAAADAARVETVPLSSASVSAERFASAVASGGAHGSAVFAALPCEAAGTGTADLTGAHRARLDCADRLAAADLTTRRTTWRLAGDVTGVTGLRTRLSVVDLI